MSFMDDLKTDQRTQILVAGMVFFAIAFPAYFGYAASNVDDYEVSGPIGTYFVDGTYSYHEIGADTETMLMTNQLRLLLQILMMQPMI